MRGEAMKRAAVDKEERIPHASKAGLKYRGWTESMIKHFFPEPHLQRPNPHYKSAPPMSLYRMPDIESVEQSEAFQALKSRAVKRRTGAKKAVDTKTEKLLASINKDVSLPVLKRRRRLHEAIEHYNDRQFERDFDRGDFSSDPANEKSDKKFLDRIQVNYLRHCVSDYENRLEDIYGRVGVSKAYIIIKNRVLDKIGEVYPWLKGECIRQKTQRNEDF